MVGYVRTAQDVVNNTRAIREWIGWQIDKGKSDEQIAVELPLAATFICGDMSEAELREICERARTSCAS